MGVGVCVSEPPQNPTGPARFPVQTERPHYGGGRYIRTVNGYSAPEESARYKYTIGTIGTPPPVPGEVTADR